MPCSSAPRRASREEFSLAPHPGTHDTRRAWRTGALLSLTNPQNVAYWAAIGSALGALGIDEPTFGDYAVYFAGFMLSSVVWAFLFAALVERVLGGAGVRYARITYLACALAFLGLALVSIRDLWQSTRLLRRGEPAASRALVLEDPDGRVAFSLRRAGERRQDGLQPCDGGSSMRILDRAGLTALLTATLVFTAYAQQSADSTNHTPYKVPRTSWGDPDLTGIWPGTAMVGVPMQRDEKLGLRNWLTDEEYVAREADFARQDELDNADFDLENADSTPGGAVGGPVSPPPHWLERGDPQRQASLIVDPSNGRMPAMTDAGQARQAAVRAASQGRGPADSYTDRSLYDRCITRGMVGSLTPAIYNAGNQIVQSPGYVVITNEMIHEARVIPLDGRPPLGFAIKQWVGDSRGHFDGDTLVVETTNFTDRTNVGQARHSDKLKITERYTRVEDDTLVLRLTVEDAETWTAPWTLELPLQRDDSYGMFEYACHEGNLAMFNILSGHRADERAAAGRR